MVVVMHHDQKYSSNKFYLTRRILFCNPKPNRQPSVTSEQVPTEYMEKIAGIILLPLFISLPLPAEEAGSRAQTDLTGIDKSRYHLFHPTPREYLREMVTDRPDKTESPYTVDAGHVQIEMDLFSYTHDHDTAQGANTRVDSWAIAPINFKMGLCNRADFQVLLVTYNRVRTEDRLSGTVAVRRGFGDVTPRLKMNFWGNDGGPTAFGMMPFVKLPANQDSLGNNAVEGGVIFPLALALPRGFGLGVMTECDIARTQSGRGYHSEFVNSITLGHDIVGRLAGYFEFFSVVSTERDSRWVGTVDMGLTYGLTENVQLDAGVNIGVTRSAEDINPFLGLSIRF